MLESLRDVLDVSRAIVAPEWYDVTLRDGNQALRQPWGYDTKARILNLIYQLGIRKAEIGFPGANDEEFQMVKKLVSSAPRDMTIGVLSAATYPSIESAAEVLSFSGGAKRRLHAFLTMSPLHMQHVLHKEPLEVLDMAVSAVEHAVRCLHSYGGGGGFEVQFSPEHFGDSIDNLDWVIASLLKVVEAGATIINLPNTVERRRPALFAIMVKEVVLAMPAGVTVDVHCHNDGGMATATTLAAIIDGGATGVEATLNGLGSRCGNADWFQVVLGLLQEGVELSEINFGFFQEAALTVESCSSIAIPEKAPYFGEEAFVNREGIHQAGVERTRGMDMGAYRRISPETIGRTGQERCEFTNQSGSVVLPALLHEGGELATREEARELVGPLKEVASQYQPLTVDELVAIFQAYKKLQETKGDVSPADIVHKAGEIIGRMRGCHIWSFVKGDFHSSTNGGSSGTATITLSKGDQQFIVAAVGDGPIDAAAKVIRQITSVDFQVTNFSAGSVSGDSDAQAKATLSVWIGIKPILGTGVDTNTDAAAARAIVDGLNKHLAEKAE